MDVIDAILLGIIQGLTEFLPVSSSGHLELGKAILGVTIKENLLFSVVLHAATALSTLLVYRLTILDILKDLFSFKLNAGTLFSAKVLLSMIPVFFVGIFLKDEVESFFEGRILFVGIALLFTSILLFLTQYLSPKNQKGTEVSFVQASVIGVAQAIAVLPGISRSGATIATALILGVEKEKAARFSFLMVLPPILGANLLSVLEYLNSPKIELSGASSVSNLLLAVGFFTAFLVGWLACLWMIEIVKKGKLIYFAIYCFLAGSLAILAAVLLL